jgi:threonylcarbamoyladenosine tRNA methylthiotransferase MtaB
MVIVNTCSVTASADQGARQTVRRIARLNPGARIVVTGCYATRRPDDLRELPNVVRVVPNEDKPRLVAILGLPQRREARNKIGIDPSAQFETDCSTADRFGNGEGSCGATIEPGVAGRTAFTLRVQTGCAEACSYCIIPTTRGAPRSVGTAEVIQSVERVAAAGFKEIALTGVHLGSYGRDLTPRSTLIELLRALTLRAQQAAGGDTGSIARESLLQRGTGAPLLFRISSLEPMDCTSEIVELVAAHDCFARHFHLPLQHASDRILAAMCRPYGPAYYEALVDNIRRRIPDASIGSDIIVGFPGESDQDFEEMAGYLERSPLTHLHVFPYSDRPGTAAAAMRDRVPAVVVRERARRIRDISAQLTNRFRDSQIGTVHRGLTLEDGSLVLTGNYLKVRIAPGLTRNEWVRVRITSQHDGELLCG